MKLRSTIRSILFLLLAAAALGFIFLPFYELSQNVIFDTIVETVPFTEMLQYKPSDYNDLLPEIAQTLNLLKEISSYLTIAVLALGSLGVVLSLIKIIVFKSKFVSFLSGITFLLFTLATLGLGIVSIVHCFIWKNSLTELHLWNDGMSLTTLGGWLYAAIGIATPVVVVFTNFIKK